MIDYVAIYFGIALAFMICLYDTDGGCSFPIIMGALWPITIPLYILASIDGAF